MQNNNTQKNPISNIFADNAERLLENGYNVIPLKPKTKIPAIKNWQEFCTNKQNTFQIEQWCNQYPNYNLGIPLGSSSGIVAIDFDYDMGGIKEKVESLLYGSLIKKQGNKGYTAFYRYNGELPKKWGKDGKMIIELLSTGNQTVVPPSIHPDTKKPYTWLTDDTLFDMRADELPFLPDDFVEEVDKLFGRQKVVRERNLTFNRELPHLREVDKALGYIPANEYATWITVGMALKHNYGDDAFNYWDSWSRKAPNYDENPMSYKWETFGKYHGDPVTIGTIFDLAMNHGYIPEPFLEFDLDDEFIIQVEDVKEAEKEIKRSKAKNTFPDEILDYVPGLPGEICTWIDSVSRRKQPILSLAASLAAAGAIYNQRIVSGFSGERPNLYTIGISPTGAGKDSARVCIDTLFNACGIDQYVFGDPTSDSALFNALDSTGGIGFIPMDELGRKLQNFVKSKSSVEGKLLDAMMQLFSSSSGTFRGKEFASRNDNPRVTIHYPSLSIYGTTTRKSLFDALTSDAAIDGFLNRWLMFETPNERPPKRRGLSIDKPPQQLIYNIEWIMENYEPVMDAGYVQAVGRPHIIPVSQGASDILEDFDRYCDMRANAFIDDPRGDMWVRSAEIAGKIALICHPYQEKQIESVTADWAVKLVKYLTEHTIKSIQDNISDTEHEQLVKRTLGIIKRYYASRMEAMPHSILCTRTNFVKRKDRADMIIQLVESGLIEVIEEKQEQGHPLRYYRPVVTE